MKFYLIFCLTLIVFFSCSTDKPSETKHTPQLGAWDYDWMQKVKTDLNEGNEYFEPAFNQVLSDANEALEGGDYSVTYKKLLPPSGSKHDYLSMGPYWWPDPKKEDGLPYIRRDGQVNPERNNTDRPQLKGMINAVRCLTQAWFFTDNTDYATKAAGLVRVWFLNKETLMNPHLEYAQAIPGRTPGRFIGVIDATSFHILVDAISLLETSGVLTGNEQEEVRVWFGRYFRWLTESEHGKNEDSYHNNHSVAYDVHSSGIAYFIGEDDFVARKARELPRRRIDPMIEADGRQPEELIRTKAYSYSVSNLGNFFNVGEKGLKVGVNIFEYKNIKGGSLEKAMRFLLQYVGNQKEWPYEQISSWDETEKKLGLIVRKAAHVYNNDSYQKIWEEQFYEKGKDQWNLLVTNELKK